MLLAAIGYIVIITILYASSGTDERTGQDSLMEPQLIGRVHLKWVVTVLDAGHVIEWHDLDHRILIRN
ncbi:hypothetical protein [Paenibacillus elgii]|uniref:hypothetical protein n=1 Tax=Paenibacillus elgii TaxID=189691 RepID=UPI000FD882B8|nr:hypothetical protein [Paenibacillus elgii]